MRPHYSRNKTKLDMQFIDSHCHIHSADYKLDVAEVLRHNSVVGLNKIICVGTDEDDSRLAVDFANMYDGVWASIGLHPHDAKLGQEAFDKLVLLAGQPKVVAVGECGLDYFYNHSAKNDQVSALHYQMELALKHDLPMIFHVRDAFDDFWPIFDAHPGIRGVIHSFTATSRELDDILKRGLYVGLNGIITFSKNQEQLDAAKAIPKQFLIIETDAPYLTPTPLRGTINEPKNVILTAEFLSNLRGDSLEEFAASTTENANKLFNLN